MQERRVGIIAECVCDLPKSTLLENDIDLVYFWIETDRGIFTDTDEITAGNVLSYLAEGGNKAVSTAPSWEIYRKVFEKSLAKYEEAIFVSISPEVSESVVNAKRALEEMEELGKRVHIFSSDHLSSGIGILVMKAAELANRGENAQTILKELAVLNDKVVTSFMVGSTEYLYRKGLVSKWTNILCTQFKVHPVLMMKKGKIEVYFIEFGDFEKASKRYIKKILRNTHNINRKKCFVTYVGCSVKSVASIVETTRKVGNFEEVVEVKASATVSSNCGPNTFGVIFIGE